MVRATELDVGLDGYRVVSLQERVGQFMEAERLAPLKTALEGFVGQELVGADDRHQLYKIGS